MKRSSRPRFRSRLVLGLGVLALLAAGAVVWISFPRRARGVVPQGLGRVSVRKARIDKTVRIGGQIESAKKTLVECELENVWFATGVDNYIATGGGSRILEIIPEGTPVKAGEVLCRLDSSTYEEIVRLHAIRVQQADSDLMKANLDLKAARMALREYKEGLLPDARQAIESTIVLAESEIQRQGDRMEWAKRMLGFGYLSDGQFLNEQQRMLKAETTLQTLRGQRDLMNRFQAPIAQLKLEMQVASQQSVVSYLELRKRRTDEQMEKFKLQIERCTIRSPRDGLVIYAKNHYGDTKIEVGTEVWRKMDLFNIPDLNAMEIEATLHETTLHQVREGMRVRAHVEALPQYVLEGEVVSLAPLPSIRYGIISDFWIKNYACRIRLYNTPRELLPGMTAEVEVEASRSKDALVVPAQAVLTDHGESYCYVTGPRGLQRRVVTTGQTSRDLLEIREGLDEGEQIVEYPSALDLDTLDSMMARNMPPTTVESVLAIAKGIAYHKVLDQDQAR